MATTDDILKKVKKDYGQNIAKMGSEGYEDTPRIPTGIFAFDLASGGGFPLGRVSIVYGVESSNKTNVVLKAIGQGQALYPDKKAVFVDAEGAYDDAWAKVMGVDTERLIVIHPEYAEQAVDIIEAFLYASDVFMVCLDSIAALSTQNEIESSAEKASVGGASLVVGKLFKKATVSFNRMRNQGIMPPAFIGINQIRTKIGVMYGDNETMPGGNAIRFASSFTVRMYGKNEMDKKISPVMPAYKKTSIIIKKWKVPILSTTAEFMMQMLDGGGRSAGHVDDWNTVSAYLKELDYLGKGDKGGWVLFGNPYPTLEACRTALYSDPTMLRDAKAQIIREMLTKGAVNGVGDEDGSDEGQEL